MSRHKISKIYTGWKQDKTVKRSISFPKQHNTPSPPPFLLQYRDFCIKRALVCSQAIPRHG